MNRQMARYYLRRYKVRPWLQRIILAVFTRPD